ncbi:MAG TPA: amidohydrolase family protein [Gemmatimonadaceae bacterium]|nr:amidohydrolase family protein [Gemmatimonadaceae bacterium]
MKQITRHVRYAIALAASCALALPLSAQTIAITGGKVYPVSGPPIENGTVLMRDGKIVAVGKDIAIPSDAQKVDATGKWVTPGLVNAYTNLGFGDVGFSAGPRELRAKRGDGIASGFATWEGYNPQSTLIAPAREGGVTSALASPNGGLISGQAAIVDLMDAIALNDVIVKAPATMVAQIDDDESAKVGAKGELYGRLRDLIEDTKAYAHRKADFERGQTRDYVASRRDLEAMIPIVEGREALTVEAEQASDIEGMLALAKEYGLKLVIAGGAEAWKVADKLAAAKVPVLTGAMNNIPQTFSSLGARQENAAMLRKAGVAVALIGNGGGDEEMFNVRNIRYEAGNAVAYGMSWDDALRGITLAPAEIYGVSDKVGSLRPGREANVVIWSGDPFEFSSRAEAVYIRGKKVDSPSRQDMLEARYKTLPPKYNTP